MNGPAFDEPASLSCGPAGLQPFRFGESGRLARSGLPEIDDAYTDGLERCSVSRCDHHPVGDCGDRLLLLNLPSCLHFTRSFSQKIVQFLRAYFVHI